jgi:hypothetical protein
MLIRKIGRRMGLLIAAVAGTLVVASGVALAATISCKAGVVCWGTPGPRPSGANDRRWKAKTAHRGAGVLDGGGEVARLLIERGYTGKAVLHVS